MNAPIILAFFLGAFIGLIAYRLVVGKRRPGYDATCEYWVYTQATKLPPIEQIMDRMINGNPHNRQGKPCIGAREGMLFTDIRLDMAVALREKNCLAFRPDLFSDEVEPEPVHLEGMASSRALVKLRYHSNVVLGDDRHLQFMPHIADAISDLMEGSVILDRIAGRLFTAETLKSELSASPNAARPAMHLRVFWKPLDDGGKVVTRGLRKIGLNEIETLPVPKDLEVLATALVIKLSQKAMRERTLPASCELTEFDDTFEIQCASRPGFPTAVRILRRKPT